MRDIMEDEEEIQPLVIDTGSSSVKAGFSGDDAPRAVFPCVVGRPKHQGIMPYIRDAWIGDEALSKRGVLRLRVPVEYGIITNWEDMEHIWHHTFYHELRVDPEEQPVLLTEPPLTPKAHRERLTLIMFETFNVPAIYVENQAVLSLCSAGRASGLVLKSGYSTTYVAPIYEGFLIPHGIISAQFGGRDLTDYLAKILSEVGFSIIYNSEKEFMRDMKEKLCYVSQDYRNDLERAALDSSCFSKEYELVDGTIIHVGKERFRCPEACFQPQLLGKNIDGVHQMIHESISQNDIEFRPILLKNIVLSGGSTLFEGFSDRLKQELAEYYDFSDIKVMSSVDAKYSAWLGGSILSSSAYLRDLWISREEYQQVGVSVMNGSKRLIISV